MSSKTPVKLTPILISGFPKTTNATREQLVKVSRVIGGEMREELRKPARTWDEKPSFAVKKYVSDTNISEEIYLNGDTPGNKHYAWLNEGTQDHVAYHRLKRIKIPLVHEPKTYPNTMSSYKGYQPTDSHDFVYATTNIPVPGIVPRRWTDQVSRKWNAIYSIEVQKILDQMVKSWQ